MRHRLAEVLEKDSPEGPMEPGLRRFWSRGAPQRVTLAPSAGAQVLDLAGWIASRLGDRSSA